MVDLAQFEQQGFALTGPLLAAQQTKSLIALVEQHTPDSQGPRRGGLRDVMSLVSELRFVADDPAVRAFVEAILGPQAFVVRATLFDKTDAANWKVPWHQDVTIAVQQRAELVGYGPWSVKAGVEHVQPPTSVLERMVTVRIHLDPCPATNGALRVMPGTHKLGRLNQDDVTRYVEGRSAVTCEALAGEVLVMRPLLLHASSPSEIPAHRRVLHFDFAVDPLPAPLTWKLRS